MISRGAQQQISTERLPSLLREVYEGRVLLPMTEPGSWDDQRRLKLFESIYRGLPIGSLTIWRTTAHLDHQRSIGRVTLQERVGGTSGERLRMYLVDGAGRVATLFEELGASFWSGDRSSLRRPLALARGSFVVFDLETRTFRMRQEGTSLRVTEIMLAGLFDAEAQHAFSAQLRVLPDGDKLANRLVHLVDAFFDFSLPVITVASDDMDSLRLFLSSLGRQVPVSLSAGLETTWWWCDTCGQRIEHPRDGLLEGLFNQEEGRPMGRWLRLVHARGASSLPSGCQSDARQVLERDGLIVESLGLDTFLGIDGSTNLFALLASDVYPKEQVLEIYKRLHTPGYERARNYFGEAIRQGVFKPRLGTVVPGFYAQEEIAATLEWVDGKGRNP
ncbi:hypothetical protein [Archangium lansingense]|uniref:Uncharacterized protein n=1 Tax=Archangium lansingense TaxID=2995310 RepID=A0ABT3ZUT8_9BACT|nr:hypothetical protein [Archangium lansinium]MCY1073160.1 hypothetical protein [Archangium lansinium]